MGWIRRRFLTFGVFLGACDCFGWLICCKCLYYYFRENYNDCFFLRVVCRSEWSARYVREMCERVLARALGYMQAIWAFTDAGKLHRDMQFILRP